jgi:hypothetical protein
LGEIPISALHPAEIDHSLGILHLPIACLAGQKCAQGAGWLACRMEVSLVMAQQKE